MKSVEIDMDTFKKIPGYTTELSVSRWKGKIYALLEELDVDAHGWMKDKEEGTEILVFQKTFTLGNVERLIQFRMEPVLIKVKKKKAHRYGPIEVVDKPNVSWKLFHDLLERKVAAARLGLVEMRHEFMPYISKELPDGSVGTFADFMDLILQEQGGLDALRLEDQRGRKPVEAEFAH